MASVKEILKKLKTRSDQLKGIARYGMEIKQRLGVLVPDMRKIAEEFGKNHKLVY